MVDRLLLFDKGQLVADGPRDKVIAMLQQRSRIARRSRSTVQGPMRSN